MFPSAGIKEPMRTKCTGELAPKARQRVQREMKRLYDENLKELGIHVTHSEQHMWKMRALLIGPTDTPYANGLFKINLYVPNDYPMSPPTVHFATGNGNVRFNPNLYTEGKVCLSILGTWSGPSWAPAMTIESVLKSVQSLMSAEPLENEPGHERARGQPESELYKIILKYETISVAVVTQMETWLKAGLANLMDGKTQGMPDEVAIDAGMVEPAVKHFLASLDAYREQLRSLAPYDGKSYKAPLGWFTSSKFDTKALIARLDKAARDVQQVMQQRSRQHERPQKRAKA